MFYYISLPWLLVYTLYISADVDVLHFAATRQAGSKQTKLSYTVSSMFGAELLFVWIVYITDKRVGCCTFI